MEKAQIFCYKFTFPGTLSVITCVRSRNKKIEGIKAKRKRKGMKKGRRKKVKEWGRGSRKGGKSEEEKVKYRKKLKL